MKHYRQGSISLSVTPEGVLNSGQLAAVTQRNLGGIDLEANCATRLVQ